MTGPQISLFLRRMSPLYVRFHAAQGFSSFASTFQNTYSTALAIGEKAALIIAYELGITGV